MHRACQPFRGQPAFARWLPSRWLATAGWPRFLSPGRGIGAFIADAAMEGPRSSFLLNARVNGRA